MEIDESKHILSEGDIFAAEDVKHGVWIGLDVKFHLPLFHNLVFFDVRRYKTKLTGFIRTSKPASVILCSMSNRCSKACVLMIATVRVIAALGLVGVLGVLWPSARVSGFK